MPNATTSTTATATTNAAGVPTIALDLIDLAENVRELDEAKADALAGSIELIGLLEPLTLRPADTPGRMVLVAGYTRYHACLRADLQEVPYTLRSKDTEHVDRGVENIARFALNPYEEARAVRAMLDSGLSVEGAAKALTWTPTLVRARMRLLELPDAAQLMVGQGVIPLSGIENLLALGQVSPALLDALVFHVGENPGDGHQLVGNLGWLIGQVLRRGDVDVFAAYLNSVSAHEIERLRLGKKATADLERAEELHKKVNQYAYGPPDIRFNGADVDQARAAGVLVELDHGSPIICDRSLYRELVKQALTRTVEDLEQSAKQHAQERLETRAVAKDDPLAGARRERGVALREATVQAHGANLDLGAGLMHGLAAVDPADMDVARFFVYALLGPDHKPAGYGDAGERVRQLAALGVRLMLEELRTDVTKTRKDGTRGALKVDYGDHRDPQAAVEWMWKFIDGAKTPGELYGRALVVIVAEQHASRLVVPSSQRHPAIRYGSRKDRAQKALKKLAGPHLPKSLAAVERAVAKAHREYDQAETQIRTAAAAALAEQGSDYVDQVDEDLDEA